MQRKAELGIGFPVSNSFEKRKNERDVCSFQLGNLFGAAYVWNVSRDLRPLFGLNFFQVPKLFEGFY